MQQSGNGAVTRRITSDQCEIVTNSMRANVKIGQRRGLRTVSAPIGHESFCRQPPGRIRKRQSQKHGWIEPAIKFFNCPKRRRQLCIHNRINQRWTLYRHNPQLIVGPGKPIRISGGNIKKDIGIKQKSAHSSPRVSDMICEVVASGLATPRARESQPST